MIVVCNETKMAEILEKHIAEMGEAGPLLENREGPRVTRDESAPDNSRRHERQRRDEPEHRQVSGEHRVGRRQCGVLRNADGHGDGLPAVAAAKRRESDEPRDPIRPVRLGGALTLDEPSVGERALAGKAPDPLGGIGITDQDPAVPVTDREGRALGQPRNGRKLPEPRQVDRGEDGSLDRSRIVKEGMADVDRGPAQHPGA